MKTFDLINHLHEHKEFSEKTFGPEPRTEGIIEHIKRELEEIKQNPNDVYEWIDVVTLAFDGAWRVGYSPEEIAKALSDKLVKNKARQWPDWKEISSDKPIEHVREGE